MLTAYEIFDLASGADGRQIKKAFRRQMRQLHPDRSGSESQEEFLAAQRAYEILNDVEKRENEGHRRYFGEHLKLGRQMDEATRRIFENYQQNRESLRDVTFNR